MCIEQFVLKKLSKVEVFDLVKITSGFTGTRAGNGI